LPEQAAAEEKDAAGSSLAFIEMEIRLDATLDDFARAGGQPNFKQAVSSALAIDASRIVVTALREGSVIVDFKIYQGARDLAELKTSVSLLIDNKKIDFGFKVLDASYPGEGGSEERLYLIKNGYRIVSEDKQVDWLNQNNTGLNLDSKCNSKADTLFKDDAAEAEIESHF
jgi:hypothetical protein